MPFKAIHWQIRFWDKFKKHKSGCWLWTGRIGLHGYGTLSLNYEHSTAHRLSWQIFYGVIPDGLFVCHKCDVRHCVNPEHLFVGTHKDNMRDMVSKGRGSKLRGEDRPGAKLKTDSVLSMRSEYANGLSCRELAKKYGVSENHTQGIIARREWTHI